jgi:hypothetical protein
MIAIGCPVWRRDWVLPAWFAFVETACLKAGVGEPKYCFVGDPDNDLDTWAVIEQAAGNGREVYVEVEPESRGNDKRSWIPPRIERMVVLRNKLLGMVRQLEPDYFLSLDSDILLNPQALGQMIESLGSFDAVGTRCYMGPPSRNPGPGRGTSLPSYGMLTRNGGLRRVDSEGVFQVDVIMAAKLMSPKAYAIDYSADNRGEDVAWSRNARSAGLRLGWDGRSVSKHVMKPEYLAKVDDRCGY